MLRSDFQKYHVLTENIKAKTRRSEPLIKQTHTYRILTINVNWLQCDSVVTGSSDSSDWSAVCRDINVPAVWFVVRWPVVQHQPSCFLHVWADRCPLLGHVRHQTRIQRAFRHHYVLQRHWTVLFVTSFIFSTYSTENTLFKTEII